MAVSIKGRPNPFPDMEVIQKMRIVGGSNLSKHAIVRLVTGENNTGSTLDGVPDGSYFSDSVCAFGLADYPETGNDGSGDGAVVAGFLGILLAAANDDAYEEIVWEGFVADVTLGNAGNLSSTPVAPSGSLIFLDASDSYNLNFETDATTNVSIGVGDIVVGFTLEAKTVNSTSDTIVADIFWHGRRAYLVQGIDVDT